MMVTHNMKDAIVPEITLIMMHEGKVILNISGEEKKKLTVEDLLHQFEKSAGRNLQTTRPCYHNRSLTDVVLQILWCFLQGLKGRYKRPLASRDFIGL